MLNILQTHIDKNKQKFKAQSVCKQLHCNIKQLMHQHINTSKEHEFFCIDNIVFLNNIYVNKQNFDALSIKFIGNLQTRFDLNSIQSNLQTLQLENCLIDLNTLPFYSRDIEFVNCKFVGKKQQFTCNSLHLIFSGQINLKWLNNEQFKYLQISIFNVDIQSHTELKYLSYIQNLSFLQINNSEIYLSLLKLKVNKLCVRRSNIIGYARQDLQVQQFTLSECKIKTSQLMSAEINQLTVENTAEISQFRQNMQTIVDDLQNISYLNVNNCKFELKTFSMPVIQKCSINGSDVKFIPFKFFQNIIKTGSNLVVQEDPEYLLHFTQEFNKYNNIKLKGQKIYQQCCSNKYNKIENIIALSRNLYKQIQFTDFIFLDGE
ncbi:Hypothetical_protein [Hexamita inflata]|uniref:Hypothetical_protein n=1 Tax=Hexamita inflata TaxID=28002 RepID=A0AA86PVS0_9EUKA|nr:Hypothetical protein HINF_LOCUS29890 [Hexamita inflata]